MIDWYGKSGTRHSMDMIPLADGPPEDVEGVYVICRREGGDHFTAVYIGEGILRERWSAHLHKGCVTEKGATHICWKIDSKMVSRVVDERDLLDGNPEAYVPQGCNVKEGG